MSEAEDPTKRQEWALKQYDTLMRYLAYEGTVFWNRSQHFLVAHAVMFAFLAASQFPTDVENTKWIQMLLLGVVCVAGIKLAALWRSVILAGNFWTNRWEKLLQEIEPDAFGQRRVLRGAGDDVLADERRSGKRAAQIAATLFTVLWWLLFTLLLVASVLKCLHIPFP